MAEITSTFTTTPSTVMASYRASHRAAYVMRWVLPAGLTGLGVATRGWLLVIAGPVLFAAMEWSVRRQLQPYLGGTRQVIVSITEDAYRVQGPDRSTSRTWTTFSQVRRVGDFWVVRISSRAAMALPVAALDGDQTAVFVELLRRKGLLGGAP